MGFSNKLHRTSSSNGVLANENAVLDTYGGLLQRIVSPHRLLCALMSVLVHFCFYFSLKFRLANCLSLICGPHPLAQVILSAAERAHSLL